ncbi:programmed cell death 1 ligand 2-like [Rhinophrynus dorsalis]
MGILRDKAKTMFTLLFLLLILSNFCTILALFAVTAPRLIYTVQYGETVQMICKFPVEDNVNLNKLKVSWEYINSHQTTSRDLLILNDGNLEMTNQPNLYKGRISLLLEELKKGQAVLEIRNVKLIDSGKYRCVLQLEGSDYKTITLEVQASYKNIYTHTQLSPDGSELLTCLSSGYPEADVYWQTNGINVSFPVNTSYKLTPDGFYNITSTIKYKTDSRQNYSCVFWNKALNERTQGSFGFSGTF